MPWTRCVSTAACVGAGWRFAGWHAAIRGRPAATTPSRPDRVLPAPARATPPSKEPDTRGILRPDRPLHHDAAVLRDLGGAGGLALGLQPRASRRRRPLVGPVDHRPHAGHPRGADPA